MCKLCMHSVFMYIYLYICKNRIAAAVLECLLKYRIYLSVLCGVCPVFVYEMLTVLVVSVGFAAITIATPSDTSSQDCSDTKHHHHHPQY